MTSKVALITGITGMDGTLLANFLLSKGYKIVGLFRNKPTNNFSKIDGVTYIESDLFDLDAIDDLLFEYKFDEIPLLLSFDFRPEIYFDSDKYREDSFGPDVALGIKYCF